MAVSLPAQIFRAYDIRGIVGKNLDESIVNRIGLGFGVLMSKEGRKTISVGHDVRESSPRFARALAEGIRAAGLDVVLLGQVATPVLYYSTVALDGVDGGIMVTGSHNPIEYNGLKLCRGVWPIWGEEIQKLRALAEVAEPAPKPGTVREHDILETYQNEIVSKFSLRPGLRVAVDCGNGTAGPIILPILERLGVEVDALFAEPDGTFPNHLPDPEVPKYMEDLRQRVIATGADLGLGFDGDSDRVGIIDERGEKKSADHLLLVMARYLLKDSPGAKVILDVKCSDYLLKDLAQRGAKPILWKTGHSIMKEKLREEQAMIAGELSGHICVAKDYYGFDDAFYAALLTLQIMTDEDCALSELFADIPPTFYTPEVKLPVAEEDKFAVVEHLVSYFKRRLGTDRVIDIDGVRATWDDGWALLRASNTTANLTARVEAQSEAARQRLAQELVDALAGQPVETEALGEWL